MLVGLVGGQSSSGGIGVGVVTVVIPNVTGLETSLGVGAAGLGNVVDPVHGVGGVHELGIHQTQAVGVIGHQLGDVGLAVLVELKALALNAVVGKEYAVLGVPKVAPLHRQLGVLASGGDGNAHLTHDAVLVGVVKHVVLVLTGVVAGNQLAVGVSVGEGGLEHTDHAHTVEEDTGAAGGNIGAVNIAHGVGVILNEGGGDEALVHPVTNQLNILLVALLQRTILDLAVLYIVGISGAHHGLEGSGDAEAGSQEVAGGNHVRGHHQRLLSALLVLERSQNVFPLVIGLGVLQAQILQPVAANPGALGGALLLGVEGVESNDVALVGGDGLYNAGIGVDDVLIVGRILGNVVGQVDGEIRLNCQVVAAGVVHAVDQVGVVAASQHQIELLGIGLSRLLQEINVYTGELFGLLEDGMVCHAVGEQGAHVAGNGQPQREAVAVGGQGQAGSLCANTIVTVIGIQLQAGIVCLSGIFLLGRILLGGGEIQGRTDVLCPGLLFGLLGRSRGSLCSIAGGVASAAAGQKAQQHGST